MGELNILEASNNELLAERDRLEKQFRGLQETLSQVLEALEGTAKNYDTVQNVLSQRGIEGKQTNE